MKIWTGSRLAEWQETRKFGFGKSVAAPRQLNHADLNGRGKISRPTVKCLSASARVMKTEKA
jgi:hypothetical protein